MAASVITTGVPVAIEAPLDTSIITCQTLSCAGILSAGVVNSAAAVSGATVSATGAVVAGTDVTATGSVSGLSVIATGPGSIGTDLTVGGSIYTPGVGVVTAIGNTSAGSYVQAAQELRVNGPLGVGVVYDTVNNIPPGGAATVVAAGNGITSLEAPPGTYTVSADFASPVSEFLMATYSPILVQLTNLPYNVPKNGWYILTVSVQNTSPITWVNGTNMLQFWLTNNGSPDTNSYMTCTSLAPCTPGAGVNGLDIAENTFIAFISAQQGDSLTFLQPGLSGPAVDLGIGGGIAVSINPLFN